MSRPAWARGLKRLTFCQGRGKGLESRPAWARGLKLMHVLGSLAGPMSRPAWARGLKLFKALDLAPL